MALRLAYSFPHNGKPGNPSVVLAKANKKEYSITDELLHAIALN